MIELKVPPVRERAEDIIALVHHFARSIARHTGRQPATFSPAAIQQLLAYSWPGNVRELRNSVEYALALAAANRIEPEDLPPEIQGITPARANRDTMTLAAIERDHIQSVLQATGGNRAQAAEILGIGIATLYRKLKQFARDHRRAAPPSS
ncbi:MAG: helix-turn-helix domain-containing protein [Desulfopila sp.]